MGVIKLEYNLGLLSETYNRLLASLPPGDDNITADIVVPTHTADRPVTLKISGLTANTPYIFHVMAETVNSDSPTIGFVPTSDVQYLPVSLSRGYNNVLILDNQGNQASFRLAVTNYGVIFQSEAEQITNFSWVPIKNLENNIQSDVGYILANPLISSFNKYIPTDLEILAILANKLLVKNMLWRPGTDAGINELLAAFSASNPVIFPMTNLGTPETPLYRGEEHFAGYEAHVWLPNREVERWRTFLQYINNLPQLYSLVQINEGEVYIKQGDTLHRHVFDFESDFANTVIEGVTASTCFERMFRFSLATEKEIFMGFCQAAYLLDTAMPALNTPDTDLLAITKFQDWSLSGRFEKQYDIAYEKHNWVYETPLGVLDGSNRFFDLSQIPASHTAIKLFLDGLLLRYLVDYHISIEDDFRSGVYPIASSPSPILVDVAVGTPRTIVAPLFSSIEILGDVNTQFIVTAGNQTVNNLTYIISSPPALGPQEAKLHYITPDMISTSYAGLNQYGTESLPMAAVTYNLTYPIPATDINYQLFVQLAEDPAGIPATINQIACIVKAHNISGAVIEFSEPITSPNAKLHWWLLEEQNTALENDSIPVPSGSDTLEITFSQGPYFDENVVLIQLWNTEVLNPVSIPLVSFTNKTAFSMKVQFSETLGDNFVVDYALFPSAAGNHLVMHYPPAVGQVLECQYDTIWDYWVNAAPNEPVDGAKRKFTLPSPCPIHEALYATLDGRVLVQGYNQQYTVLDDSTIQLTFTPAVGQKLWFSYPTVSPLGVKPESKWYQGYLARQGTYQGSFALCDIYNDDIITPGDSITLMPSETLLAMAGGGGQVQLTSKINETDSLTFVETGITFTAVGYTNYTASTVNGSFAADADVDTINNTINLINHGLLNNQIVYLYFTGNTPAGILSFNRYFIASATINTFKLSNTINGGDIVDITSVGSGIGYVASGALPTEFPCFKSKDEDGQALTDTINNYYGINSKFIASYANGIITIKSRLPNLNQTLTKNGASMTVTSVTGGLPLTQDERQFVTFSALPTAGKFALLYGDDKTPYINFNATAVDVQNAIRQIPYLNDVAVSGNFTTGFIFDFIKTAGGKSQPLLKAAGPNYSIMPADVNALQPNSIRIINHEYHEAQPVAMYTSGVMPAGLTAATTYYVHVLDDNNIALTATVGGAIVPITSAGSGSHAIYGNTLHAGVNHVEVTSVRTVTGYGNRFLAGVSRLDDTNSLVSLIQSNIKLSSLYNISSTASGHIGLTAKNIGARFNSPVLVSGNSIRATHFTGGTDARLGMPMRAEKHFYNISAPVVALDGISTRLYKSYGGDEIKFDTEPTPRQEPYIVSQVYPVKDYPLDSMEVNLPCAYPKGQYTQGLSAHLSDVEIEVAQDGTLIRVVNNLPLQEAPSGVIDGVNTVFDLSLPSCAGQNSLLLWLDGIFQPPTAYTYSLVAGHGRITFATAPASEQTLWAWYIPYGDACVYEHVVELAGTIDGVNQNFTIPNSPMADKNILLLFLDGLLNIQDDDYTVDAGNTAITFSNSLAPNLDPVTMAPQTLWAHFNEGVLAAEPWRQVTVGMGDGVATQFTIPHLLTTELPTSKGSIILSMNGLVQRESVDFTVQIGLTGFPTGLLTFTTPPDAGRIIQTAYITRSS